MPSGCKAHDLTGRVFTNLTVKSQAPGYVGKGAHWVCSCVCGKDVIVQAGALNNGASKSCGCYKKRHSGMKHGLVGTRRYALWKSASMRAKLKNLPFDIEPDDIPEIPDVCPILGIALTHGRGAGGVQETSPTLDRIVPSKGYVKGNIQIISQRANVIKNDATPEEIMKVAVYMARMGL